jgi:hypothetical protein
MKARQNKPQQEGKGHQADNEARISYAGTFVFFFQNCHHFFFFGLLGSFSFFFFLPNFVGLGGGAGSSTMRGTTPA